MLKNTGKLAGRIIFITGASRGIGKAIAIKAAKDGAKIVIAAKTAEPHPKLPGTIYTAAKEIESAGGKALPCIVDVRDEKSVTEAVEYAVSKFGAIDILINNASAISLTGTLDTTMKKYDLMNNINSRGTFLVTKVCLPHLLKSDNPHILNISPPLNMKPRWFRDHAAYTLAKYGMSTFILGMAEEFKSEGVACNALWPKTAIRTAAMDMLGGEEAAKSCRNPEIVADAAYAILCKDSCSFTGKFVIDEDILREEGITDFDQYAVQPGHPLLADFFLDDFDAQRMEIKKDATGALKFSTAFTQTTAESQIGKVFKSLEAHFSEAVVAQTKSVYVFDITGDETGKWFLDLKNGTGSCGPGDPPGGDADVTFKLKDTDFHKLFAGSLKPTAAFMTGKMKVTGDIGKAMKLDKLMGLMKSKL